jgi:pimeloyl-ACP methyl ester carboxylesterase
MNDNINPQFTEIDGLRIRYASGGASTGRAVLLTSPWPESIVAFRDIWPALATAAPLVAIDLPGFGQSGSRPDFMNPRAMGDFLVKVLEAFSLDRPHALSPDVGTSAALYAAATHQNVFSSLIVGAGAMDESLVAGTLKEIVEAPDTTAFEGVDGADIVAGSIGRLRETAPTEEELRDYRESYAGDRFLKSMAYVRSYPRSLPALRDLLPSIKVPVQVIYGNHDPLVPPAHADVLGRSLPRVRVVPLDSGHFAWQDAAPEYAAAARAWIDGGFEQA